MTWQLDHLEAGDRLALLDGAGDLNGAAVPERQQRDNRKRPTAFSFVKSKYGRNGSSDSAALALGRVAVDRGAEHRGGAAVVGVGVAEHHPLDPAEPGAAAAATAAVMSEMPASKTVTPPSSSIR